MNFKLADEGTVLFLLMVNVALGLGTQCQLDHLLSFAISNANFSQIQKQYLMLGKDQSSNLILTDDDDHDDNDDHDDGIR